MVTKEREPKNKQPVEAPEVINIDEVIVELAKALEQQGYDLRSDVFLQKELTARDVAKIKKRVIKFLLEMRIHVTEGEYPLTAFSEVTKIANKLNQTIELLDSLNTSTGKRKSQ